MRAHEIFEHEGDLHKLYPNGPLYAELRQLMDWAEELGVVLDVAAEDANTIMLLGLYRTKGDKGAGAQVMNRLCDIADSHNMEITLDAEGGSNGLFAYYRRWGFDLEEHVLHDMEHEGDSYAGPWVMYRLPRTPLHEGPLDFHKVNGANALPSKVRP